MIAGELPATPTQLSEGTGPVTHRRQPDPGQPRQRRRWRHPAAADLGGRTSRQATPETIAITNNTIANNVSAHEGGGIALDDAAFVNIVNNTVVKNLTTATAVTSDGTPAAAGLSTAELSDPLLARLRSSSCSRVRRTSRRQGSPSRPCSTTCSGTTGPAATRAATSTASEAPCPTGPRTTPTPGTWGSWASPGTLHPVNSVLQTTTGTDGGVNTRVSDDPLLRAPYDLTVDVLAARTYPAFRQAAIVTTKLPAHPARGLPPGRRVGRPSVPGAASTAGLHRSDRQLPGQRATARTSTAPTARPGRALRRGLGPVHPLTPVRASPPSPEARTGPPAPAHLRSTRTPAAHRTTEITAGHGPEETTVSDTTAPGASRRSFLLGAAGVGASLVVGARVVAPSPATGCGTGRRRRTGKGDAQAPPRRHRRLGVHARPARPPTCPFFPDPLAPNRVQHLHVRFP